jgi:hypothetical protein
VSEQADIFSGTFKPVLLCRCVDCAPSDPAPTYMEEFRRACEARWLAALPSDGARSDYLDGVREERGEEHYQRLRRDTWLAMGGKVK